MFLLEREAAAARGNAMRDEVQKPLVKLLRHMKVIIVSIRRSEIASRYLTEFQLQDASNPTKTEAECLILILDVRTRWN